jgi:hypothetical protein
MRLKIEAKKKQLQEDRQVQMAFLKKEFLEAKQRGTLIEI